MSKLEYTAGIRLEAAAHNLRSQTGANAFHSTIHAALRLADSDNLVLLRRMFPKTYQELMLLRDSAKHDHLDTDVITVAKLLARIRNIFGMGYSLYEISAEIANITGDNVDSIHGNLTQYYDEIFKEYEG